MTTLILFYGSLLGLCIFFVVKIVELNRGTKPFSAMRYQVDLYLKRKFESLLYYLRFVNKNTARLLIIFLLTELRGVLSKLFHIINEMKWVKTIKGKQEITSNGNSSPSSFLRDMGNALRSEKRPPSN